MATTFALGISDRLYLGQLSLHYEIIINTCRTNEVLLELY